LIDPVNLELALGDESLELHREAHVALERELASSPGRLRIKLASHQKDEVILANLDLAGT